MRPFTSSSLALCTPQIIRSSEEHIQVVVSMLKLAKANNGRIHLLELDQALECLGEASAVLSNASHGDVDARRAGAPERRLGVFSGNGGRKPRSLQRDWMNVAFLQRV